MKPFYFLFGMALWLSIALLSNKQLDREFELAFPDEASLKSKQGKQFRINQFIAEKIN